MEDCSNEILGRIFTEACTDDGLTGRSLSLVSRRIRCASRRYALRSVALYGNHQLSAFASLLDQVDDDPRQVCHLYLTDRRRVQTAEYPPGQAGEQWLQEHIEGLSTNDIPPMYFPSTILRILTALGPTLQTLALLLFHHYDEPIFSDALHVPELRDLTIHSSTLVRTTRLGPPPAPPKCPSLQRLHIIQDFPLGHAPAQVVSGLSPPLLTHLRPSRVLSDDTATEDGIIQDLKWMVQSEDLASDVPSTARFPLTLERVLIQPSEMGHRRPSLIRMNAWLTVIAMCDLRSRILLLKPAEKATGATPFEDTIDVAFYLGIRAAWEERVSGAESAIWDVAPSEILASRASGYCAPEE
ncbi:hypothetical protein V8D89_004953 [Ganoderma adspersum]